MQVLFGWLIKIFTSKIQQHDQQYFKLLSNDNSYKSLLSIYLSPDEGWYMLGKVNKLSRTLKHLRNANKKQLEH